MSKRLGRMLWRTIVAASLLAAVGVTVFWVRSYRRPVGQEDRVSAWVKSRQARYTLQSHRGRVTLLAPPFVPPEKRTLLANGASAQAIAGSLLNRDLSWQVEDSPYAYEFFTAWHLNDALKYDDLLAGRRVLDSSGVKFSDEELAAALLPRLEATDSYVASHCVLARVLSEEEFRPLQARPDGVFVDTIDGLRIEVRVDPANRKRMISRTFYDTSGGHDIVMVTVRPCLASIDPSQLPKIRDQWHRRLDVPVVSAPHWALTLAAAALPLFAVMNAGRRRWVRRSRMRARHCITCGYNLVATPDRCPECGTAVNAVSGAT